MKLEKTQGSFSKNSDEQARQTQEFERSAQEAIGGSDAEIQSLTARITALEELVASHHP